MQACAAGWVLIVLPLLGGCASRGELVSSKVAPVAGVGSRPQTLRAPDPAQPLRAWAEILKLPDEQFDIAEAVLALGHELWPTSAAEAQSVLRRLDQMALQARQQLPEEPDGIDYFDALYDAALDRRGAQPWREDRAEDYDLRGVLSNNRGACLAVGLKTLAVARRMEAPIWGTQVPGHFLLRYVGHDLTGKPALLNLDVMRPTPEDWRKLDDAFYRRWARFDRQTQRSGAYLQPLTDRQVVALYLASRSGFLSLQKRYDLALHDAQRALQINSKNVTAHINAGFALESLGRLEEAQTAYAQALALDPHSVRALNNLAYLKAREPNSSVYAPKEAERLIAQALQLEPEKAWLRATQAEILAAKSDWRAAVRAMQQALRSDKKNPQYRERFLYFRRRLRGESN